MAKPIELFPHLQLGYFSLWSFASKLGFAVLKGKIFSDYGVTVYEEPGRRKGVVNTARDDDASGLTALLRIDHLAGGFWQFRPTTEGQD
jgi:hypothetical protein